MSLSPEEIKGRRSKTLFIDRWSSTCGNCGKSTMPQDRTHHTIYGYGPENGSPGCGVEYEYVSSNYTNMREHVLADRPDLKWLGDD